MATTNTGKRCPECKSRKNIILKAETICNNCGLVLSSSNQYVAGNKIELPCGLDLLIEE